MPSIALQIWNTTRAATLDEIEQAHRSIGGSGPGRRYATLQINHAYTVLLSSQFQGFCRNLHTESAEFLSLNTIPPALRDVLFDGFRLHRRLDTGNPNPGNLGADFGRFGLAFWQDVYAYDSRNNVRRQMLEQLNDWRNAIAHQDFTRVGGTTLHLHQVRRWRTACTGLARSFDRVMQAELTRIIGLPPW